MRTLSITTPEAVALVIVLTLFVALWCLIGYVAWTAMRERLRNGTPPKSRTTAKRMDRRPYQPSRSCSTRSAADRELSFGSAHRPELSQARL
jgi:hypothetical protein